MRFFQSCWRLAVLLPVVAYTFPALAQDEADPPSSSALEGDAIHLKSGTVMSGVQVLRSTPQYYVVELELGVEPMQIPRRQVEFVEYDDIDPNLDDLRRELFGDEDEVVEIATGEKVSGVLRDKLLAPAMPEGANFRNRDFVEILRELRESLQIDLRIHKSIRDRAATQRLWTVEIPPDKTLMTLLREDLTGEFGFVDVLLEPDHILIMTKAAAAQRKEQQQKNQNE